MKLWTSLTITSFGAQITNLALPLTAAVLLHATPWQMGVLVALETLPFALVSLHAGVLIDRVRKLPIVIAPTIGRGVALLAIPVAAYFGALSIEILFVVGFLCGIQNVVGGAAYQVLLAQMAGREPAGRSEREGRARRDVGRARRARACRRADPARHGAVRDPARRADVLRLGADAAAHPRAATTCPIPGPRRSVTSEIHEGLKLVWNNRTLLALAWLAGAVADPAPHADRGADPVRDARARPVGGRASGSRTRSAGWAACSLRRCAERLSARFGVGPVIVHGLTLTALGWQAFGLISGPVWLATLSLGMRDADVRLRRACSTGSTIWRCGRRSRRTGCWVG